MLAVGVCFLPGNRSYCNVNPKLCTLAIALLCYYAHCAASSLRFAAMPAAKFRPQQLQYTAASNNNIHSFHSCAEH
jgi:hypothetical protein